jgi:hypothetical protein
MYYSPIQLASRCFTKTIIQSRTAGERGGEEWRGEENNLPSKD